MTTVDASPYFSSEAQESFVNGCDVFVIAGHIAIGEGAEGTYVGRTKLGALVDFKTPSGDPYRVTVPFGILRNLYR